MGPGSGGAPARRLTREARREQLLDVAADLLRVRTGGGFTMEGLAVAAGVSKAVPYQSFENSDGVLVALYRREMLGLATAVAEAVAREATPADRLRAAVRAYFDVIIDRGAVLVPLFAPGSSIAELADGGAREGYGFVADLLRNAAGLGTRDARLAASLLIGTLNGAADALAHRVASRKAIEARVVEIVLLLTDTATTTPADTTALVASRVAHG